MVDDASAGYILYGYLFATSESRQKRTIRHPLHGSEAPGPQDKQRYAHMSENMLRDAAKALSLSQRPKQEDAGQVVNFTK